MKRTWIRAALALSVCLPVAALAHKAWLLPSETVLSNNGWITVDAAISNDLFETFVTAGKPNDAALKPTRSGLELVPVTHPNDLFAGEAAEFRFVLDGKPAANVKVLLVPGGSRYRTRQNEQALTTDAEGKLIVTWPEAGMYWLEATVLDDHTAVKPATSRRATYVATFEVLPQ